MKFLIFIIFQIIFVKKLSTFEIFDQKYNNEVNHSSESTEFMSRQTNDLNLLNNQDIFSNNFATAILR